MWPINGRLGPELGEGKGKAAKWAARDPSGRVLVRRGAWSCFICLAGDPKRYTLPQTPRDRGPCGAYHFAGMITCCERRKSGGEK